MKNRIAMTMATAILLTGALGVAGALAGGDTEAETVQVAQATPPDTPETPEPADPPTVTCPRCGAECPGPYGRHGRGVRAPKGRSFHGSEFRGRGHAPRGGAGRGAGIGRGDGVPAERMLRNATRLDLSEDQIAQLETLSYETQAKLIDLESDQDKARLEMRRQMETNGDDLSAMKKHLDSMAKIRVNIQELKLKNWIDAKNVLNEEQKQKVKDHFPRFGMRL
jgi:Spy/CpxP family protein refolding chaperone